jgi:hypothetical protein
MPRYTKAVHDRSYIIQSAVALCAVATLSAIVTVRFFSADQLSLFTKILFSGSLWGFFVSACGITTGNSPMSSQLPNPAVNRTPTGGAGFGECSAGAG